ncbi:MAG: hypothetical protein LBN26_06220 [Christensenellaceae bacterium]|jgi:hypothetical protein|nr:hypothetical protein [Christensenellaceae bacterium]
MQLYTLLLLCIVLLSVTGASAPACDALGMRRWHAAFFAVSILALSRFTVLLKPECSINFGALLLPLFPARRALKEGARFGAWAVLLLFAALGVALSRLGGLYGAENGLLSGLAAGCGALLLCDTPCLALGVAAAAPLLQAAITMCVDMLAKGYGALDISGSAVLNAQVVAVCFGALLLCLFAVRAPLRQE